MIRLTALALALVLATAAAAQESVVTGLSTDNIALNASFDGSEIFVFGAIRREGPPDPAAGPLDVIVTIKGPTGPAVVRRKDRRFGIWINNASVRVREAPSYYAIASTRPLAELLTETERLRHGIGMDQAVRRVESHPDIPDTRPFAEAVVRLREENGLYSQHDGGVGLAEDTLFQTRFEMPSNSVEGRYDAEFFLVRDRTVISSGETSITVQKTGIERWLFNLAHQQPLYYAVLSLGLALSAGWLAAAAFRLARR
jgi:uncharacterized protein (TIGR02186 family)